MLAAYLRHEKITHSADGSISLEELAVYDPLIRQLCHSYYDHTDTQGLFGKYMSDHILIPNSFRRYGQLVPFYMPLALVLVYNDKGRFEMAVVRNAEYRVSTLPNLHEYESFPSWRDDLGQIIDWPEYTELRKQFAERVMYNLEDIVMIHLRAVSGQSANQDLRTGIPLTREYIKANPKYAFLVHATVLPAMPPIEKNNLRPMGRRESDTRPTHFVPYTSLAHDPESLRFQTNVIIVYSGHSLCNCNEVTVTSNGYVNLHDKDGIPLSTALFAYDLYNQSFWFSTFRQKYYAPIPNIYELMVTPKSQARPGSEHYADLYQYMRIYCEFKWMVMEDHSKGMLVGRFETYKQKAIDALKNQQQIDHWKRVTAHPDPPRSQRRPPPQTSQPEPKINLLDLAHQVSESADEQQTPVRPKSMPTQPKQTPKPPPKPVRPAPSPPSTPAQPKDAPSRTPQREMPKELAKATATTGRSTHEIPASKGVSLTPGYTTSTVSVPLGRHKKRRITDRDESRQPAQKKKETQASALAGESIDIALAVIESQIDTKDKKPKKGKKTAAKSRAASWRPSLDTHAEETKKKRKKKKGEADEEEEDLTQIAADTEEEEEVIEVEEEKEQEDEDDDEEEADQPERDDKDDDDDNDAPGAGSASDKKKARPKKRSDTSKSTTKGKSKKTQKEATYRVVEVKESRYPSRGEGELCDICGDAVGIFHCRKCNMLSCVACCQSEHRCQCGVSHLTSSVSADLLPPMIDTMHSDE